jgi:transcriptional regulator with PAS, ATPase and Fis domain
MPPLRERREDIEALIDYYLVMYNEMYHKSHMLSEKAKNVLMRYSWPGNLRELSHVIEKVVVLTNEKEIGTKDLPKSIFDLSGEVEQNSNNAEMFEDEKTLAEALGEVERRMILSAYEKYKSSVQVAKVLGISQPKAYRLMAKYIPGYKK